MKKHLLLAPMALFLLAAPALAEGTHMICSQPNQTVQIAPDRFGYCATTADANCPSGSTLNTSTMKCEASPTYNYSQLPKAKCQMWNGQIVDQVPAGNCP